MDKYEYALKVEQEVATFLSDSSSDSRKECRKKIRGYLLAIAELENDASLTLVETLDAIAKNGAKKTRRDVGILALRLMNVDGFFPSQASGNNLDAKYIGLVEPEFGNFYNRFDISCSEQTFEKVNKLNTVHSYCLEKLQVLLIPSPKIENFAAEKQSILRAVGDDCVKSYLSLFDFQRIRAAIESVLTQSVALSRASDLLFTSKLKDLSDTLEEELQYCSINLTFVTRDYYQKFLLNLKESVEEIATRSKARFVCDLKSTKGSTFAMEKNYPLYAEGLQLRLPISLVNEGPGIADQVVAFVNSSEEKVIPDSDKIELGSVVPGLFVLPVSVSIVEPVETFDLNVILEWRVIGDTEEKLCELRATVNSQSEDTDWNALSSSNPYGLEIAIGEDFYGRRDKLTRLLSRLDKSKMRSSYITGQRRVGKSSLARAVQDNVQHSNCNVLNIECGDFKRTEARDTVKALGEEIEQFLTSHLPNHASWEKVDMSGTLGPLSRLLKMLEDTQREKRFVIIIDEFDEINPDMYRHSEIAETFFLSLRSISGKPNICFILVGAEKMAFVMSSQGEKLNKFVKESLDTFDQNSEWTDFEDLVRANIGDSLTWHDSAIRAIYSATNGHPYFAKQVCSKVYESAIQSRDSEITDNEVEDAISDVIAELDVNAFQHFWRDGIQGNLDETEIVSLKRCRVLVAYARSVRSGKGTTWESISENLHSSQMSEAEVLPILTDFCRRGIMTESGEEFHFTIDLFKRWLVNNGFQSIIADQLGDELAETQQKAEDQAFVRDDEIENLVSNWPDYQGMLITSHMVRSWLGQVESNSHQRILFKLLQNLRFFGDAELRRMLNEIHDRLKSSLAQYIVKSKAQRRKDIWLTYLDGPGKSGANLVSLYADSNKLSTTSIKEMVEIDAEFSAGRKSSERVSALIIVDDFVGSGDTLVEAIKAFYERNGEEVKRRNIQVIVVAVCATSRGEQRLREALTSLDEAADLQICEVLQKRHFAFSESVGIWDNADQKQIAKEEIVRIGRTIDRTRPLGYGSNSLLVVFSRNCPNNSLPLLHSSGRGSSSWKPLFERVKH